MKPILQLTKLLRGSTYRVQLAIDDPEQFVDKYQWTGMDPKDPSLPWLAMLDGARIADLDWRSDLDEVMAALGRKMGRWTWVDEVKSTGEFIERVSVELKPRVLLSFDDESDSFRLLLTDVKTASAIERLAKSAGFAKYLERVRPTRKKPKRKKPHKPRKSPRTRDQMYPWYNFEVGTKFWAVRVFPKAIFLTWGRIGTQGGFKSESFQKNGESNAEAGRRIAEKKKEGYRPVSWRPPYFED